MAPRVPRDGSSRSRHPSVATQRHGALRPVNTSGSRGGRGPSIGTMPSRSTLVAPLVFLIGCAVGGAASRLAAPPALAQGTPKWEYFCIDESEDEELISKRANQAGAQGWEMVSAGTEGNNLFWCFKRPR